MTERNQMTEAPRSTPKKPDAWPALIGSPKQIDWAEKIRIDLDFKFDQGIRGLNRLTENGHLFHLAKITKIVAFEQRDAAVWIDHREGRMFSIAERAGLVGSLLKRLNWEQEERKLIGIEIFDKICDYTICNTDAD